MDQSMEELVKKAITGDQMAISDLYDETADRAYYLALEMVKDEDMAEDILQDSYVKAFGSLDTLSDPSKFQSWFNTIVVNTSKNYLKKKTPILFSQMSTTDEEGEEQDVDFVDESEEFSPEATVDYSETKRLIDEMIDKLPDEQRIPIILHYMEDYSIKQIAKTMECSEGTVKSRLDRGRDKIEKDVLDLEKKGTKLYCAPLAGFLIWMFHSPDTYAATAGFGATAGSVATVADAEGTASSIESTAIGKVKESTIASVISETTAEAEVTTDAVAGSAVNAAATVGTTSGMAETAATAIAGTGAKAAAGAAAKAGIGVIGRATVTKIAAAVVAVCVVGGGAAAGVTAVMRNNSDDAAETRIAEIAEIEEGTGISDILLRGVHPDEPEEIYFTDEHLIEEPYADEQGDEPLDTVESNELVDDSEFVESNEIVDDGTLVNGISSEEIYAEVIDMHTAFYNGEISSDELSEWVSEHEYPYDFSATFDKNFNPDENPYYRHSYYISENTEWFYAFYDINNDGIEELLLSSGIWTWDGEKPVIVADNLVTFINKNVLRRGLSDGSDAFYEIRSDGKLVPFLIYDYGCEAEPVARGYVGGDSQLMEELANVWPYRLREIVDDNDYWNKATDEELDLIREWSRTADYELNWHPLY